MKKQTENLLSKGIQKLINCFGSAKNISIKIHAVDTSKDVLFEALEIMPMITSHAQIKAIGEVMEQRGWYVKYNKDYTATFMTKDQCSIEIILDDEPF